MKIARSWKLRSYSEQQLKKENYDYDERCFSTQIPWLISAKLDARVEYTAICDVIRYRIIMKGITDGGFFF